MANSFEFLSDGGLRCCYHRGLLLPTQRLDGHSYIYRQLGLFDKEMLIIGPPEEGAILRFLPKTLLTSFEREEWAGVKSLRHFTFIGRKFRWESAETDDIERVCRLLNNLLSAWFDRNAIWEFNVTPQLGEERFICVTLNALFRKQRKLENCLPPGFLDGWTRVD